MRRLPISTTRRRLAQVEARLTDPAAASAVLFRASARAVMAEAGRTDPDRFPPLTDDECRRWQDVDPDALGFGLSATLRRVARSRLGLP